MPPAFKSEPKTPKGAQPPAQPTAQSTALASSGQLQQEVQFWRDMLSAPGSAQQSRESLERMKQALALAEYRLAALDRHNPD